MILDEGNCVDVIKCLCDVKCVVGVEVLNVIDKVKKCGKMWMVVL